MVTREAVALLLEVVVVITVNCTSGRNSESSKSTCTTVPSPANCSYNNSRSIKGNISHNFSDIRRIKAVLAAVLKYGSVEQFGQQFKKIHFVQVA